jgi:hypothetical protein
MRGIYTYIRERKTYLKTVQCCSYSVVTTHGACNAIYSVVPFVLLH